MPKTKKKVAEVEKIEETQTEARERLVTAIMEQDEIIEVEKEENEYVPKMLIVELWKKHENNRNFDVKVGQVIWSDTGNDIFLESINSQRLIQALQTDVIGGPSRRSEPREWVRTLYRSENVTTDIYAKEALEIFDDGHKYGVN